MSISPSKRLYDQFFVSKLTEDVKDLVESTRINFGLWANWIYLNIPDGPDKTVALRQLLEAKDTAVRAVIFAEAPRD